MDEYENVKCTEGLDPRTCREGERLDQLKVHCYRQKGGCEYPGLFGGGTETSPGPYKSKIHVPPGPSSDPKWVREFRKEG